MSRRFMVRHLWKAILKSPTIPPTPFLKHLFGQVSWFHWNGLWEDITRNIAQTDSYILTDFLEFIKKANIHQNLLNVVFTAITRKGWHNYPEYIHWRPESSNVTKIGFRGNPHKVTESIKSSVLRQGNYY